MALNKKELSVSELYLRYYGEVPSLEEIKSLLSEKKGSIKNILKEMKTEYSSSKTPVEQINIAYNNLFGRDATDAEKAKYMKSAEKDKLDVSKIIKGASKLDKAVYKNKADAVIVSKTLGIDIDIKAIT